VPDLCHGGQNKSRKERYAVLRSPGALSWASASAGRRFVSVLPPRRLVWGVLRTPGDLTSVHIPSDTWMLFVSLPIPLHSAFTFLVAGELLCSMCLILNIPFRVSLLFLRRLQGSFHSTRASSIPSQVCRPPHRPVATHESPPKHCGPFSERSRYLQEAVPGTKITTVTLISLPH